jgi:hypothetical protein
LDVKKPPEGGLLRTYWGERLTPTFIKSRLKAAHCRSYRCGDFVKPTFAETSLQCWRIEAANAALPNVRRAFIESRLKASPCRSSRCGDCVKPTFL